MERPRPLILLALALLAVLAAYAPSLTGTFVWDDHMLIVENPRAHELSAPSEFFTRAFWSTPFQRVRDNVHSFYRPLVGLSYALDWVRSNGEPAAFHVTNVLLHLLVVALVFALARQLGASGRAAAAAAGAFGLLPRLTESVAWISGRTDVLAACFALLALWVERAGPPRWGRRVAVARAAVGGALLEGGHPRGGAGDRAASRSSGPFAARRRRSPRRCCCCRCRWRWSPTWRCAGPPPRW